MELVDSGNLGVIVGAVTAQADIVAACSGFITIAVAVGTSQIEAVNRLSRDSRPCALNLRIGHFPVAVVVEVVVGLNPGYKRRAAESVGVIIGNSTGCKAVVRNLIADISGHIQRVEAHIVVVLFCKERWFRRLPRRTGTENRSVQLSARSSKRSLSRPREARYA